MELNQTTRVHRSGSTAGKAVTRGARSAVQVSGSTAKKATSAKAVKLPALRTTKKKK
jgi:hypothetical protein